MAARFMIYGATGYTGKLIARRAKALGLQPVLAARDESRLRDVALALGFEYRVVPLVGPERLDESLRDISVVLNCAGPFSATAEPMAGACLRSATHYLDVTGEIPVFDALQRRDPEARSRGVMIMPGVGYAVLPSDCLAAYVAAKRPGARYLRFGISRWESISRGSAKTMIELLGAGALVRRRGRLLAVPVARLEREFDYGRGNRLSTAVSWPDVFSAFHTTAIPNIEVYLEAGPLARGVYRAGACLAPLLTLPPWQGLLKAQAEWLPEGPSEERRLAGERILVAEAENSSGERASARLRTPEPYSFTAVTALAVVERVLQGEFEAGYQTPARVFGANFVLSCAGVFREDLLR